MVCLICVRSLYIHKTIPRIADLGHIVKRCSDLSLIGRLVLVILPCLRQLGHHRIMRAWVLTLLLLRRWGYRLAVPLRRLIVGLSDLGSSMVVQARVVAMGRHVVPLLRHHPLRIAIRWSVPSRHTGHSLRHRHPRHPGHPHLHRVSHLWGIAWLLAIVILRHPSKTIGKLLPLRRSTIRVRAGSCQRLGFGLGYGHRCHLRFGKRLIISRQRFLWLRSPYGFRRVGVFA